MYRNLYQKPICGEGIGSRAELTIVILPTGHAIKLTSKYLGYIHKLWLFSRPLTEKLLFMVSHIQHRDAKLARVLGGED